MSREGRGRNPEHSKEAGSWHVDRPFAALQAPLRWPWGITGLGIWAASRDGAEGVSRMTFGRDTDDSGASDGGDAVFSGRVLGMIS